jgi:hypothetical protein
MFRALGGCVTRLLSLVLLLIILALAWVYRAELGRAWHDLRGDRTAPGVSEELAASAEGRIRSALDGTGPDRIVLTQADLQSLLAYRWADSLPDYVGDPTVELVDGRMRVGATVPTNIFGALREADEIAPFLPDTAELAASGQLVPLDAGYVALEVHEITASRIPLPKRIIPLILDGLGRRDRTGLARDAMAVRLPPGIVAAFVSGDSLVFLRSGAR